MPGDKLGNLYEVKLINKTDKDMALRMQLEGLSGEIKLVGSDGIRLKSLANTNANFFIILDKDQVRSHKTPLKIGVYSGDKKVLSIKTNFLGPFR